MTPIRSLTAAGILVIGAGCASVGTLVASADTPAVTTPGTDLSNDIQSGQAAETATLDDHASFGEADLANNDGEHDNINNAQVTQSGVQADTAGDSHTSTGTEGSSGDTPAPKP